MLEVERHRPALRRGAGAARRVAAGRARQGDLRARPQRRRQDQPAARARRPASDQRRRDHVRGRATSPGCEPYERARRGIAYVPQGREIFPLLTVEENLKTGFAPLKRDQRDIPDDVFCAVSGAQRHAAPARRRPVRRPAAAAGDRPRAGDAAAAAAARRADRRHPALDHQGYRPRHRLSARARSRWRSCWSSSISTSPASSATISWSWIAARSSMPATATSMDEGGAQARDGDLTGAVETVAVTSATAALQRRARVRGQPRRRPRSRSRSRPQRRRDPARAACTRTARCACAFPNAGAARSKP